MDRFAWERIQAAAVEVPVPALQRYLARNVHSSTAIEGNPLTLNRLCCQAG